MDGIYATLKKKRANTGTTVSRGGTFTKEDYAEISGPALASQNAVATNPIPTLTPVIIACVIIDKTFVDVIKS